MQLKRTILEDPSEFKRRVATAAGRLLPFAKRWTSIWTSRIMQWQEHF